MRDRETPLRLVRKWEKMCPGVYAALDDMQAAKQSGEITWPDYCELPVNAAFTYLRTVEGLSDQNAAAGCAELTALWAWRKNKIIYSFDDNLAKSLADQAEDVQDTDVLPADLLMHLPYPCIYVKAHLLEHTDGFFVWMDYDINWNRAELRVQWMFEDMEYTFAQVLHILPGRTIRDCVLDTVHTTQENLGDDIKLQDVSVDVARVILSAVQLLLYLVSQNADIEAAPAPVKVVRTSPKTVQIKPDVQDKASQVRAYDVGVRVGAALRKAARSETHRGEGAGTGTAKRPHSRRGHWHHYWTGPMDGERKLVLKWTAPTIIHPDAAQGDNILIVPVKGEK